MLSVRRFPSNEASQQADGRIVWHRPAFRRSGRLDQQTHSRTKRPRTSLRPPWRGGASLRRADYSDRRSFPPNPGAQETARICQLRLSRRANRQQLNCVMTRAIRCCFERNRSDFPQPQMRLGRGRIARVRGYKRVTFGALEGSGGASILRAFKKKKPKKNPPGKHHENQIHHQFFRRHADCR